MLSGLYERARKMKKRTIAIASVLKPADDVRAFTKMALTLAAAGHEVYLIGMPSTTPVTPPNVHFLELSPFSRLDFQRILAPFRVLRKARKVKPEVLIVNTHELLLVSFLNRIFFGTQIIYDVQENYYRNIRWTRAFPSWMKRPLAAWVRLKERLLAPAFQQVIFAERCYLDELRFLSKKATVIENKSQLPPGFSRRPDTTKLVLAFTGTLGESTGIFEAIKLADELYEKRADIELHVLGFCPIPEVLAAIISMCSGKSYIKLTAGSMQVGHEQILDLISRAHFGIISYPASPHTSDRIPTKLFEYLSARLPVLLRKNPSWEALASKVNAAILVDFDNPDTDEILRQMASRVFYDKGDVGEFLWKTEEGKLVGMIEAL
jgi:glycosyltransferase involved in cell wall biosynthesis